MKRLTFATFLAPNVRPVYEFVARSVAARLGCETRLITGSSYGRFETGEIDVAFLCSPPYLRLASRGLVEAIAAPVLQGARYGGRPVYFSDVVVRAEAPFRRFEDLRGRRWSFNDLDSYSGYAAAIYHLVDRGETPAFFGRWIEAGSHEASIQLILSGEVDAAAIDSQVLAIEARRADVAGGLRTIAVLGPAPIQPVVAACHLPAEVKEDVRQVLLSLRATPGPLDVLSLGFVERFVTVSAGTYEPIRARMELIESQAIGLLA